MITARSVKALLDNLRPDELELPFEVCGCWINPDAVPYDFAEVKKNKVVIHQVRH